MILMKATAKQTLNKVNLTANISHSMPCSMPSHINLPPLCLAVLNSLSSYCTELTESSSESYSESLDHLLPRLRELLIPKGVWPLLQESVEEETDVFNC